MAYIEEVRSNASSLNSAVQNAKRDWYDANYKCIAEATADYIHSEAESFCSAAQSDAQMIYTDLLSIETIINNL